MATTTRKPIQFKADDLPGTTKALRGTLLEVEIALRQAHREAQEKLAQAHCGGACPLPEGELMVELTARPLLALGYSTKELAAL